MSIFLPLLILQGECGIYSAKVVSSIQHNTYNTVLILTPGSLTVVTSASLSIITLTGLLGLAAEVIEIGTCHLEHDVLVTKYQLSQ